MLPFEEGISLRERKQARTKVLLAQEFVAGLQQTGYDDISVKEACERVEVSEGTFYNYFNKKIDMINYIISLYCTRFILQQGKGLFDKDPLFVIDTILKGMFDYMNKLQVASYEVMTAVFKERKKPQQVVIPALELYYAFPECADMEYFEVGGIEDLLKSLVKRAVNAGLIREDLEVYDVLLVTKAILTGTVIISRLENSKDMKKMMNRQLSILWEGIKR